MTFVGNTETPRPMDKELHFDGLAVYVDATSQMYLDGCTVDYVETLEVTGFKFINPNVKTTCGCGSSFSVWRRIMSMSQPIPEHLIQSQGLAYVVSKGWNWTDNSR